MHAAGVGFGLLALAVCPVCQVGVMLRPMVDVPDRLPAPEWRTSDEDRERVATVLRNATAEGRLDLSELDDRLGKVYAARTYADLVPLTRDLPIVDTAPGSLVAPKPRAGRVRGWAIAVLSGFNRVGHWIAPQVLHCVAVMGGGNVDLREAQLTNGTIKILAYAVMGGVNVIVPEDADVHMGGFAIMGGFDPGKGSAKAGGSPTVIVGGFAIMGGVSIQRKRVKKR